MVRLKEQEEQQGAMLYSNFQFQHGTIKSVTPVKVLSPFEYFQFQHGTIKSA